MDSDNDEQPLFQENTLGKPSHYDGSDSEDDFGLSSMADHDQYDNLNIPSTMKDMLRLGNLDIESTHLQDDSDSDTDSLYKMRPLNTTVDINSLNVDLANDKFQNFPLMPAKEEDNDTKTKKTKKPREKKKRRDKEKKKATMLEARQQQIQTSSLDRLLKQFEQEASTDEEESAKQKKSKQPKGRKTRKQKSSEPQFDENGELLTRSTELLNESSGDEEQTEKKLSKKQEIEMYRENERLRRAAKIRLKPVYNVKTFEDLVKRQDEREEEYTRKLALAKKQALAPPAPTKVESDDDSDIEIIGDPKKIAAALMSPERARIPVANWSPVRHATTSLRNHNKSMLARITNEGYAYRIKMEEQAKARGQYASATERARQLIEKEKNALLINEQINQHFEKNKGDQQDDEDDEDDDYEEDGLMNEYSGSSDEEEFTVEDVDDKKDVHKRKLEDNHEDEDEDDMATMAFKRWKNKKIKKSIFDDDDDDEDEGEDELKKKKSTSQKPVPTHSIANFFKAKVDIYIYIYLHPTI